MNRRRASVSRNTPVMINAKVAVGIVVRATNASPITKVRAASSIARLGKRNGRINRNDRTEDRHAALTASPERTTAKIDIIIIARVRRSLRNRCRRSR